MRHQRISKSRRNNEAATTEFRSQRTLSQQAPFHPFIHLQQTVGNQATGRILQAKLNAPQSKNEETAEPPDKPKGAAQQRGPNPIQNCSPEKEKLIAKGVGEAKRLVANALSIVEKVLPPFLPPSVQKHFGIIDQNQHAEVIRVYRDISASLDSKKIICDECKQPKDTPEPHLCGQAPCPGNEIILCPPFGVLDIKPKHRKGRPKSSCPPGPTILHEAAHNAGACSDIKQGAQNYPPSNAKDNAYSYENFAVDVAKGAGKGKGKKKGSRKP